MGILNLNDVPPPKDKTERATEREPPTPVAPVPPTQPSFDTSALTAPPPDTETKPAVVADPVKTLELKPKIVEQLATVFDPEIPVNIYELGLIYDIAVDRNGLAVISMTLTAPGCPAAVTLPAEVQSKVKLDVPHPNGGAIDVAPIRSRPAPE